MKTASVGTAPGRVSRRVSGRKCFQTLGDEKTDAELYTGENYDEK